MGMGFVTLAANARLDRVKELFNDPAKLAKLRTWFANKHGDKRDNFYSLGDICGVVFDGAGLDNALDVPLADGSIDRFNKDKHRLWQLHLRMQYRHHRRFEHRKEIEDVLVEVLTDPTTTISLNFTAVANYRRPDIDWNNNDCTINIYFVP